MLSADAEAGGCSIMLAGAYMRHCSIVSAARVGSKRVAVLPSATEKLG